MKGWLGMEQKLCIKPEEMARRLGIGRVQAYQLTHQDGFPAIRLNGGRRILIPIAGLEKWLEEQMHTKGA